MRFYPKNFLLIDEIVKKTLAVEFILYLDKIGILWEIIQKGKVVSHNKYFFKANSRVNLV